MRAVNVCLSLAIAAIFVVPSSVAMFDGSAAKSEIASTADEPRVLRIGILQAITNLNPFSAYEDSDYVAFGLIYDRLIRIDEDLNSQPSIASSWEVVSWPEEDDPATTGVDEGANRLWRYHIVENATWHDNEPVKASDVAFSININLNASVWAYTPYINSKVAEFARAFNNNYTVEVYLKIPSTHPETLDIPIVPVHLMGTMLPYDIQYSWTNPNPVGSGPFKFVEFVKDQYLILERNPNYHLGPVAYDQVVFTMYGSDQVMSAALKNGDIDVGKFPPLTYESLKNSEGVITAEVDRSYQSTLGFNCYNSTSSQGSPLLRDTNIRRAMHLAIDKQYIIDTVWRGYADMGYALPAPVIPYWHWEPSADEALDYNVSRANQLLNESGYDKWNGEGIRLVNSANWRAPLNTPLSFKFQVRNDNSEDLAAAPYIKEMWKEIGIDVTILPTDESALETDVYSAARHEAYIWYWSGDVDPNYILGVMTTDQLWGWNDPFWSNATYDELFLLQRTQTGAERQQTVFEMQRIWYESSGMIVLSYPKALYAWTEKHFTNWGDPVAHPGRTIDFYFGAPALFMMLEPVTTEDTGGGGGISSTVLMGAGIGIAVVVVAVVAYMMMKKRKASAPGSSEEVKEEKKRGLE